MKRACVGVFCGSFAGWRVALGALAAAASCTLSAAPSLSPVVRPEGAPLKSSNPFALGDKARRAVSGIACGSDGSIQNCLVVVDEGGKAQFATLGMDSLEPAGQPIALLASGRELDAEGAATDGQYFYVVGSHSVKRKGCTSNPASRHLVRFKATWTASQGDLPRLKVDGLQDSDKLWSLMQRDAYLGRHIDGCLGSGTGGRPEQMRRRPGLNIEGIAVQEGRLYVGFRGPSEAGMVPVYSVEASALFDGSDAKPRLERLQVGRRVGIRDMVAGANTILLLLGPDDHDVIGPARWWVAEWKPSEAARPPNRPRMLAELDLSNAQFETCVDAVKPEALSIIETTANAYRIVVLSDGVCDGGALLFNVPR